MASSALPLVILTMTSTIWDAETRLVVKTELRKALRLRRELERAVSQTLVDSKPRVSDEGAERESGDERL